MKKESFYRAVDSIRIEQEAVLDMLKCVESDAFADAVDLLSKAGLVMTCASGTSGIGAKKFAHSLCCIDIRGMFMPPCEAVHGGLGALKEGDALVVISRGGKTAELLPIIDACAKRGAKLIAITENMDSPLAKAADVILPLYIKKESDKYNMMATSSYMATIALCDALLVALMEEMDYRKEQFAPIHPGGAVGARLNP
ncbi:MAG: SIS domain-containing protein [Roseburia sp.]|nr:SIS domain-containing protein [Roseburia sp.]